MLAAYAGAEPYDLSGGVFIAHYAPSLEYTGDTPEGGWDEALQSSEDAIYACEDQNNRIDGNGIEAMWFVVCAWAEDKEWCATQFGVTGYPAFRWVFMNSGPCYPGEGAGLEIYTNNFPHGDYPGGPSGVILGPEGGGGWSGTFVPVWYFNGHVYGSADVPPTPMGDGLISLGSDPSTGFGGWYNCEIPPLEVAAGCFGAIGLNEDGVYCCPPPLDIHACCFEDGTCEEMTELPCARAGGVWYPDPTCDPNPCQQPPTEEVCCFEDGSCQILLEEDCVGLGGTWRPDLPGCDPNPCPPQIAVCCYGPHGGQCEVTTEEECAEMGGEWIADWDSCEPNPCHTATGVEKTTWGSIKAIYR
jgi:hypothetical protein